MLPIASALKGRIRPSLAGLDRAGAPFPPCPPASVPGRTPARARLVVAVGRARGQAIAIAGPRFVIGRDPACQLRPRSETISRRHTALEVVGGRVYVRDLGGTNGTVLNGRKLRGEVAEAADGARLRVGPLKFVVRVEVGEPGADDLIDHWMSEGDGSDLGESGGTDKRAAAAPVVDDPNLLETEVETGVADIECKVIQGILVVTVKLPALDDESAVGKLRDALTHVSRQTPIRRVVVSLCNVAFLSRPAMGVLVAHMLRLEWEGGGMRLCHILTPVMAVLKKIHLPLLVETHPSLDDAVLTSWN